MKNTSTYHIFLGCLVLLLCIFSYSVVHLYSKTEAIKLELNKKRLTEEFLLCAKLKFERDANIICQSYDKLVKENIALKARLDSK